jgi:tetratricopeptide (TPR) repeat protein
MLHAVNQNVLAEEVLTILNRPWFRNVAKAAPDLFVTRLLLGVYVADRRGAPLSKREAAIVMGAHDAKTARKYVSEAEQRGLIETFQAPFDRRKELLRATESLNTLVEAELRNAATELHEEARGSAEPPPVRPMDKAAYYQRALRFYRVERDEQLALHDLNQALNLDPGFREALELRAAIHGAQLNYESQIADLSYLLEMEPDSATYYAAREQARHHQRLQRESRPIDTRNRRVPAIENQSTRNS